MCIIDNNSALKVDPVEIGMNINQVESICKKWSSDGIPYMIWYDDLDNCVKINVGEATYYVLTYNSDGYITKIQYSVEYTG